MNKRRNGEITETCETAEFTEKEEDTEPSTTIEKMVLLWGGA